MQERGWSLGKLKEVSGGTSLVVQQLRLCTSTAEGVGLIPGQGTKILNAAGAHPPK